MTQSTWGDGGPDKTFAYTWNTTVLDMARLGLLILNRGVWEDQRILDEAWIYRMTHPAFEDANTGWGYLTWLNAASHHHFEGVPLLPVELTGAQEVPRLPGSCAPVALDVNHPHGLSDAPDCQYTSSYSCTQRYDVGVWQALGLFGQVIQGHPGLDLLVVAKNVTGLEDISGMTASARVWDALRPALIAADSLYRGDEAAFCRAYGRGDYAPAAQSR
jgi:CubicO group peptidase (beta-lactamase class C family)